MVIDIPDASPTLSTVAAALNVRLSDVRRAIQSDKPLYVQNGRMRRKDVPTVYFRLRAEGLIEE